MKKRDWLLIALIGIFIVTLMVTRRPSGDEISSSPQGEWEADSRRPGSDSDMAGEEERSFKLLPSALVKHSGGSNFFNSVKQARANLQEDYKNWEAENSEVLWRGDDEAIPGPSNGQVVMYVPPIDAAGLEELEDTFFSAIEPGDGGLDEKQREIAREEVRGVLPTRKSALLLVMFPGESTADEDSMVVAEVDSREAFKLDPESGSMEMEGSSVNFNTNLSDDLRQRYRHLFSITAVEPAE